MPRQLPARELPIVKTVKASYLALAFNRDLAVRLSILPFLLAILQIAGSSWLASFVDFQTGAVSRSLPGGAVSAVLLVEIAYWLTVMPMITAWHRLVIMGHGHPDARLRFSFQRTEWLYIALFLLLGGIMLGVLIAGLAVIGSLGLAAAIPAMLAVAAPAILAVIVLFRLSLILPAAAVDRTMTLRESWDATLGNTARLVVLNMIALAPIVVLSVLVSQIFGLFDTGPGAWSPARSIAGAAVVGIINIVGLLATTSVWSWAYRYLVEGEDIVLPGERA